MSAERPLASASFQNCNILSKALCKPLKKRNLQRVLG